MTDPVVKELCDAGLTRTAKWIGEIMPVIMDRQNKVAVLKENLRVAVEELAKQYRRRQELEAILNILEGTPDE